MKVVVVSVHRASRSMGRDVSDPYASFAEGCTFQQKQRPGERSFESLEITQKCQALFIKRTEWVDICHSKSPSKWRQLQALKKSWSPSICRNVVNDVEV